MEAILRSECIPNEKYTILSRIVYFGGNYQGRIRVLPHNGSLLVQDLGWNDRGSYRCFRWNELKEIRKTMSKTKIRKTKISNSSESENQPIFRHSNAETLVQFGGSTRIKLSIDGEYRHTLYQLSLLYGFATAGGFLLITLLAKLIYFLLHK